ncbi:uncharacterized protein LOC143266209 [Megachile rotundata]|uniref:uncharacterized protein LOC143266209 n=1 Tax=Megachile rotundata TaxID=143995 RepID=UPI003FD52CED
MADENARVSNHKRPNYMSGSQQTATVQWQQKYCLHCERLGHRTSDCRRFNQHGRPARTTNLELPQPQHIVPRTAPSPNNQVASPITILRRPPVARPPPPTCTFCGNIGHTITQCRKKAYQDKRAEQAYQDKRAEQGTSK